jgi:hypothetical protein
MKNCDGISPVVAAQKRTQGWLRSGTATAITTAVLAATLVAIPRAEAEIPPAHRVKVLLTALSFDKTLKQRASDKITIGIVGKCDTISALQEAAGKAINGLPIAVQTLGAFESESALDAAVKKNEIVALYLCEANETVLNAASAIASKHKVVTLAEDPSWVESKIALGVGEKNGRAELVINLPVSRAAGADFDARIFAVARVVQ